MKISSSEPSGDIQGMKYVLESHIDPRGERKLEIVCHVGFGGGLLLSGHGSFQTLNMPINMYSSVEGVSFPCQTLKEELPDIYIGLFW